MRTDLRFSCPLPHGIHARPASLLAEAARRFVSRITIGKEGGPAVDARSVLSVVGLDIKHRETFLIAIEGDDASAAAAELRELIEGPWAHADEVSLPEEAAGAPAQLPIGLRGLDIPHCAGRGVCGGIGIGAAVIVSGLSLPRALREAKPKPGSHERDSALHALSSLGADLRRRAARSAGLEADLLAAHAEIADDPALRAEIESQIARKLTAPQAVVAAAARFSQSLAGAASAYIRDRALDVQDIALQLLDRLIASPGGHGSALAIALESDSIVLADTLTAGQLLAMDRSRLKGLALGSVGATAHTVILARSLCIPTVLDARAALTLAKPGEPLVLDGDGGFVLHGGHAKVRRYYQRHQRTLGRRRARLEPLARRPAATRDGRPLEIGANASTPAEAEAAFAGGADGIGLLRTELLFLDRETAPTEQEQLDTYSAVLKAAAGRPVIIRTLDIGGDKPAPYLHLPREENPFLGRRGLRLYEKHPDLLLAQLRAICRASAQGKVKVMAPMVTNPREAAWFKKQVRAIQAQLKSEGVPFDPAMPVGVMVEVPALALVIDALAAHADFLSLGTNDLSQYWSAADRGNPAVSSLADPLEPAFLRLLITIADAARKAGTWIGICGEMGGRPDHLPLMVGLGLSEISAAPGDIPTLKASLAQLDSARCRSLLERAAACRSPAEVRALLRAEAAAPDAPILDPDAILVGSDADSKEEAIREAVDALYIAGRTNRPRVVEEAAWAREATYSTGLGYGFAIPHCKTDAVAAPSLAVVKLQNPVDWGSTDGLPVRVVILLAIPAHAAPEAHLKVFATLARRLMHETFRDRLMAAADRQAIQACLQAELGLA